MYIESATLTMSEAEKPTHYPTGTVQVKRALGEWEPSAVTWNTQPEISEDLNWSSIFVTLKLKKSLYYRHLFSNGVRYPFDECGRI